MFALTISTAMGCSFISQAEPAYASLQPQTEHSMKIQMKIKGQCYDITLYDNPTSQAFAAQLPVTLEMMELNGNEKYAELPHPLPTEAIQPITLHAGDLMLYGNQTLVLFYTTFKSSYRYTLVGRVDSPENLTETIGKQNVRIAFSNQASK